MYVRVALRSAPEPWVELSPLNERINVPAVTASCLDLKDSHTVCLPLANERRPQLFKDLS